MAASTDSADHVDTLHGVAVADPHRWLEDATDDRVQTWIDEQSAATERWLADAGQRDEIRSRLAELWDYPRAGVPWRRGESWFQLRNSGLQDQDVLWVADAPDARGRVLLDPNTLSTEGTTALTGASVSVDGALIAYAVSERGSDWRTWRVRDVSSGEDLGDQVEWSKFSPSAWHPDGSGFYYGSFAPPDARTAYQEATRGQWLAFHRLGDRQAHDEVVAHLADEPEWIYTPEVTDDGRWLVVTLQRGTDPRSRVWVADLSRDGALRPLLDAYDAAYELVGATGDDLLFVTDRDAPRGRVVAVDAAGGGAIRELVAEEEATLQGAQIVGHRLLTLWLRDAVSQLRRHELDGTADGEVALPGIGSVESLAGRHDDAAAFFAFASFDAPPAIYRHWVASGRTELVRAPQVALGPEEIVTEQVFATSADGTRVPLFLVHREDVRAGEGHPTVLWGYGGFDIPVTPMFRVPWHVWVERGGVLAVANLRGGGEYGKEWHEAGRLRNKQRVFDDALGCGQWLLDHGWAAPDALAIQGASNGGLLAGACLTQRPDLFAAAVVEVGVLDMLRFHLSTIGWAWKSDYGDPDDPDDFATLHAYSPLHNVKAGTAYPATLVTTGDHDDRVVPFHSFKFAAALQAAQAGPAPILLRVDRSGGHGAGKPTAKVIDERADVLTFLTRVLSAGGG